MPDHPTTTPEVEIGPLASVEDALAFKALNEEWIRGLFSLEAEDRQTLDDPQGQILDRGGHIFLARQGARVVGCVALVPGEGGTVELAKMAVTPGLRGQGIGRRLLEYAVAQARQQGVRRLFLGSSTRLPSAVHLYEAVGFQHLPAERRPHSPYVRADVFMELDLT